MIFGKSNSIQGGQRYKTTLVGKDRSCSIQYEIFIFLLILVYIP